MASFPKVPNSSLCAMQFRSKAGGKSSTIKTLLIIGVLLSFIPVINFIGLVGSILILIGITIYGAFVKRLGKSLLIAFIPTILAILSSVFFFTSTETSLGLIFGILTTLSAIIVIIIFWKHANGIRDPVKEAAYIETACSPDLPRSMR